MNILFVADQPPFPARNGVTIPTSGYIEFLKARGHRVDLVILQANSMTFDNHLINSSKSMVDQLFIVKREHFGLIKSIFLEICKRVPNFHAWQYSSQDIERFLGNSYDLIIASPLATTDFPLLIRNPNQKIVAAISDCYTGALRSRPLFRIGFRNFVRYVFHRVRSLWMEGVESNILSNYDHIVVQTELDKQWIGVIGGNSLFEKTVVISNGVNKNLLQLDPISFPNNSSVLLFVADFKSFYYQEILHTFHSRVWPVVLRKHPDAKLRVVGVGLSDNSELYSILTRDASVEILGFVPELKKIYKGVRVSIAPIKKKFGFINKVAESLASGVPVVGDVSAFNGLNISEGCGYAFVANSDEEFINSIDVLLTNDDVWSKSVDAARTYAMKNLSWESRHPLLEKLL